MAERWGYFPEVPGSIPGPAPKVTVMEAELAELIVGLSTLAGAIFILGRLLSR